MVERYHFRPISFSVNTTRQNFRPISFSVNMVEVSHFCLPWENDERETEIKHYLSLVKYELSNTNSFCNTDVYSFSIYSSSLLRGEGMS